ncbi:D-alanine--D-alanine ligase family protein [Pseudonocardia sp. CA-107938]|uniref:D-alanine--D-alanine ligase family protein n=1 Tax=Pseudonocardia sp. CA-107938 TaxID=3240021 RepID=UPI003D8C3F52
MSDERLWVAVVHGGTGGEHDVSCRSAEAIVHHLDPTRFRPVPVYIERDGRWTVAGPARQWGSPGSGVAASVVAGLDAVRRCDVAFPAMHGEFGEDGHLQGVLAALGVPTVGCGLLASALGMDKVLTKTVLAAAGLTVADGVVVDVRDADLAAVADRLPLPVFVKPSRSGSSIGLTKVSRWADLPAAIAVAAAVDPVVLVEAAIPGREIDIGVLELPDGTLRASPPLEIILPDGVVFDYATKYDPAITRLDVPAALDLAVYERMREQALRAFRVLQCAGLLRVDFFVRPDGELVLNEVNTFPGFTSGSQYPRMWEEAGLPFRSLLTTLIETALAKAGVAAPAASSRTTIS